MKLNLPAGGFFLINKQSGYSSTRVVSYVKRLSSKKTGHGGTLDPMACGVLIIAFGYATRLLEYALNADKEYIFQIRWGSMTDSYDATGKVIAISSKHIERSEIEAILPEFTGLIEQTPPIYSALKVAGKPAYERARNGEDISLKKRQVNIKNLTILEHNQKFTRLKTSCSKGTYIRSLANDIATKLDYHGHVDFLERTKALNFDIADSIKLDFSDADHEILSQNILSPNLLISHLENIELNEAEYNKLIQGQTFTRNDLHIKEESFIRATFRNDLIGIVGINANIVYPKKIFVNQLI